tara:strand:- start:204 stop:569 length:366 start_codon:yes stop_codon:yes gene_type:complete
MPRFKEIEINGETLPISFGMGTLLRYCRTVNIKFDAFASNIQDHLENPDALEQLVFCGFVQGHRMARKQMNIEVEDVLTVDVLTYSKYVQLIADGINGEGGNPEAAVTAPGKKQPLKKAKA